MPNIRTLWVTRSERRCPCRAVPVGWAFSITLLGTLFVQRGLPIMKQQRSGKIITVSSVAGTAPSADGGIADYGATKAAYRPYTRYLTQDLGPFDITANCIAPGVIATGRIMQTVIPGSAQNNRDQAESVALRRLGTVEDCARVVEFLATDLFDYVTRATIPLDGGLVRGQ
jgi:3-oxoacyl-[acyl-carrier protein] reductase